ncbi:hypothetical protein GEMRC1_013736 [Eukaryota sp. GEM-RC1]
MSLQLLELTTDTKDLLLKNLNDKQHGLVRLELVSIPGPFDLSIFLECLKSPTLKYLDVSNNDFDLSLSRRHRKNIRKYISQSYLHILRMSEMRSLNSIVVGELFSGIRKSRFLKELIFTNNRKCLPVSSFHQCLPSLAENKSLLHINFKGNVFISASLTVFSSICSLCLWDCQITFDVTKLTTLVSQSRIQNLELGKNHLILSKTAIENLFLHSSLTEIFGHG